MLKTTTVATTALLTMLGGTFLFQGVAHADSTTTTNATISVTSGGLNIDPLASIDFNAITLNGQEQTSMPKTKGVALNLHDYRGSTTGWYLQANYKKDATLGGGMTLKLDPTSNQGEVAAVSLNADAQNIDGLKKADVNNSDTNISLNPTITVPAHVISNKYTATIVWNVVDGAPSE
ncbi:hypothetical protein EFL96_10555 [Lactococcus lactis]|uniref:hypothetical protein n=1 Tax=Lactococcus lactis TaxID=1358 RepID=UPI00223C3090|nr:hypothetical protein [Lactococcus lactis]MCT1185772.1 hypothetical protein [Lactococcus lactis]MCT1190363.1 hypothetical protein [Lactococcus lactis]